MQTNTPSLSRGGYLRAHKGKVSIAVAVVVAMAGWAVGDTTLQDAIMSVLGAVAGM